MEDSLDVPMEPPTEADPSLLASPGVPPPPPGTGSAPAAASLDGDVPMSEPNAAPIPGAVAEPVFADFGGSCNPEADLEMSADLFHHDNGQGDMHENAMEKLIHTDFFNNFKDDFDDTELD